MDPKDYFTEGQPLWAGQSREKITKSVSLSKELYDELQKRSSSLTKLVIETFYIMKFWEKRIKKMGNKEMGVEALLREAWMVLLTASQEHYPTPQQLIKIANLDIT